MAVKFYLADIKFVLNHKRQLKKSIEFLFSDQNKDLKSLTYVFTSDEYLLKINQDFLKHDYFTDVITFTLSAEKNKIEGEVYISIDRVKENAKQLATDFSSELHRVMIHGALHLCGHKDKLKKDQFRMRNLEEKYLFKLIP